MCFYRDETIIRGIMKLNPARRLTGELRLPGDKSISHRAAMIGSIADGVTSISNFGTSEDCSSTLACLSALGVAVERDGGIVRIFGKGKRGFTAPSKDLDCGNSGTTARLMSGILAGQDFESVLSGDESLRSRPMGRVIEPLRMMGAEITSVDERLPMTIAGSAMLSPIEYDLPVASAQVKSCVLLAGLHASGMTAVTEPPGDRPGPISRDHTELMLKAFGAGILTSDSRIENNRWRHTVSVSGDSRLEGRDISVPGDISSAAFLIAAASCLEGSAIVIRDVGINPTRSAVLEVFREIGAEIEAGSMRTEGGEPVADLKVRGGLGRSGRVKLSGSLIPNLIDEIPVLAVVGTRLAGGLEVRGASELRHKETDRISAVVENLRKMGADVEEFADGFRVGRSRLKGARVGSFGDHRIAMAFAVAALIADGETMIDGSECVNVSFPGFFGVLENVVS